MYIAHQVMPINIPDEDMKLLSSHFDKFQMSNMISYNMTSCLCGHGKWIAITYDDEIDVTYATKYCVSRAERLLCYVCQHQRAIDLERAKEINSEYRRQEENIGREESEKWIDMFRYISEEFRGCVNAAHYLDFDIIASELKERKPYRYSGEMPYDNRIYHGSRKHSERVQETFRWYERMNSFKDACMTEHRKRIPEIREHNAAIRLQKDKLLEDMKDDLKEAKDLTDKWTIGRY